MPTLHPYRLLSLYVSFSPFICTNIFFPHVTPIKQLSKQSENFKISARRVQRHMCRRNAKWTIIVIVGSAVVVAIIVLIILNSAGVFDHK
uniref:V-SNARE coiled-coil homology domain-containing protein n=1 Tax=Parascaris equorum TaxID=6256 RepID=A0A914S6H2_PAREQ